ncbi:uncharacterized protein LOC143258540 [Tachypleus tridentatus]|uniref:uncharacterized protein LOC143258540 n=1 Tax=Tachypleus tridentatus TaxID=6853 RepID=UPI003FD56823
MELLFLCTLVTLTLAAAPVHVHEDASAQGTDLQYRNQDGSGNYKFGYKVNHFNGESFHKETGDAYGNKAGSYGVRDADGRVHIVNYVADATGYHPDVKTYESDVEIKDVVHVTTNKLKSEAGLVAPENYHNNKKASDSHILSVESYPFPSPLVKRLNVRPVPSYQNLQRAYGTTGNKELYPFSSSGINADGSYRDYIHASAALAHGETLSSNLPTIYNNADLGKSSTFPYYIKNPVLNHLTTRPLFGYFGKNSNSNYPSEYYTASSVWKYPSLSYHGKIPLFSNSGKMPLSSHFIALSHFGSGHNSPFSETLGTLANFGKSPNLSYYRKESGFLDNVPVTKNKKSSFYPLNLNYQGYV